MERKLTAILSADVEGYSRLMGEDEEATIRTLTSHRQVMTFLIPRNRGRVVDSPGDNLLAEFGSVVDAVKCAAVVQSTLRAENANLPENRSMEFRIGINLGDVIVEGERIYGDGVNIAARMEGLAEPGGICISGTVFEHIKGKVSVNFEDLGPQHVKNIAEPIRAYRVVLDQGTALAKPQKKVEVPRRQPPTVELPEKVTLPEEKLNAGTVEPTPLSVAGKETARLGVNDSLYGRTFVGRERELRQLQGAFDATLSYQGSLAMVVGEPGIGKTSLCEQLVTYVTQRGGMALVGHCYEEGSLSLPYLPFVEAMRSYVLTQESDDLRRDLGSGAADVARLVSEIQDRLRVEVRPPGDPEDDRWRLLQAVSEFLRNASMVQPLLVVLEDLQDADRGTLDLLLHISHNLQGTHLLIVGTYRDVEVDRAHPLSSALAELRRAGSFLRVSPRGLTVEEVQRMMSIVRGQDVPWSGAEAIHRQTEGNPLFVHEVLRYLVEEGIVVRESGRYLLADSEAGIPEGLRDVVGKRLSRLTEKANQILSVAAVIGREFRLDVLEQVAGLPEEELYGALEEATGRAVIEQRQAVGTVGFRFTHAFFRQTLYEEIFVPRRIRLHQQVGKTLEEVYSQRLDEHAAELTEHFIQSTERGDLEKALSYSEMAAKQAMQVFAYGEAARRLEQALRTQEVLDPDNKAKRCDLLLALGEALGPAGEPQRAAEQVATEALRLAEFLGDDIRASRACELAVDALHRHGGHYMVLTDIYLNWAESLDRYAAPNSRSRAYADCILASVRRPRGKHGVANALVLRALELARRLDDPEVLFRAAASMMFMGWPPQYQQEQRHMAYEITDRPRHRVRTTTLALVLQRAQTLFLAAGDRARTEQVWRELSELANHTRDVVALLWPLQLEAVRATLSGELESSVEVAARLKSQAIELGIPRAGELSAEWLSFQPLLYLGHEDASPIRERVLAARGAFAVVQILKDAHQGRSAEALMGAQRSLANLRPQAAAGEAGTFHLATLLEVAVVVGDRETATLAREQLQGLVAIGLHDLVVFNVARQLGGAAALLGDREDAQAEYERALAWATSIQYRPEIALTRLQLAELLLQGTSEEKAQAREHLDFAISEFREMKMKPALERALRHKNVLSA